MRLDRLVTLKLVAPWQTRHPQPAGRLPILMYHRIAEAGETARPYYRVCTSPARFAQQMQWLTDAGWRALGLTEALAARRADPHARVCALTFDDGFRDFHLSAAPVLQRHGFRATVYLPTGYIHDPRACFRSAECLTWEEARTLQHAGIEFGSHTVTHPQLYTLSWCEIRRELEVSKLRLEFELRRKVTTFAYPYAFPQADREFCTTLGLLLRFLEYQSAVTTMLGRVHDGTDTLALPRVPVNELDDRPLFLAKLAGGYDWVAAPQSLAKTARRWLARPPARPLLPACP